MPLIEAHDLVKTFSRTRRVEGRFSTLRTLVTRQRDTTTAVAGVSFAIDEGEIVGYLGPNGAGKSTTIKMLTGILVPTSGSAIVASLVPWEQRERNALNIGVVFGQRNTLWWNLPLGDSFHLIAKMYRVPDDQAKKTITMLTELLEMQSFLATPVRQLSLGQKMRGNLAAAMIYEPPVLFLDEPTVGLDAVAKERMRSFIEEINRERRTTVLLTTHDLDDVERLCHRIMIIDRGRVVFDGATRDLRRRFAPHRLLDISVAPDGAARLVGLPAGLPAGVALARRSELGAALTIDPTRIATADAIAAIAARIPLTDLTVREPELENVIRQIYETPGALA
ncbi:MAG: ABC transporter ATP-binding protein [Thermomicrobiales bacterium]